MLKKRVIILFYSLFLFNLNAESNINLSNAKLLEDTYTNSTKQFFSHGVIIKEDITTPITVYRVKNKFNYYDFSIKVKGDIYKSSSKELDELSNKNSKKVIGENKFIETLPLALLNYGLRNREYTLIEKAITFKYKGLETNKILIIQKEILEEPEQMIVTPEPTTTEETMPSEEPITEEPTFSSDDIGFDLKAYADVANSRVHSIYPKVIPKVKKITFKPAKYEKLIYFQAKDTNQILRKEFYISKGDRNPVYIVETSGINYINGYYVEVEYTITDFNTDQSYIFKYNTETMLYNKEKISNKFKDMTNFYGVK